MKYNLVKFDSIKKNIALGEIVTMDLETFFDGLDYLNSRDGYENTVINTYDSEVQDDIIDMIDNLIKRNHKKSDILKKIKEEIEQSDCKNGPFYAVVPINGKIEQAIYNCCIQQNVFFEKFKDI